MTYHIEVDHDACIGCGACVAVCEKGFKLVDNKSIPFKKELSKLACEQEAVDSCPVNCIKITEK